MSTKARSPGRPRGFDVDAAVATAQQLFHARGYDGVSVAEIVRAVGINPPSFYAAFGSKAGLYRRALDRWTATDAIPLDEVLVPDRPVAEGLAALLEDAARLYAARHDAAGCLVLEGTRAGDPEARMAARALRDQAEARIRAYVATRHPDAAARVAGFVGAVMAGMSAQARDGHTLERLRETAHLAAAGLRQTLSE